MRTTQIPRLIKDSVDEVAAAHIGKDTRIRNLVVEQRSSYGISWKGGLPVSPIADVQMLFQTIFGKVDKKRRAELLSLKKSMLDASRDDAKSIMSQASKRDRVPNWTSTSPACAKRKSLSKASGTAG